MRKLDRVFDGNNVVRTFGIDLVDQCCKCRRLTRTSWSGNQHQAAWIIGKAHNHLWHTKFGHMILISFGIRRSAAAMLPRSWKALTRKRPRLPKAKAKVKFFIFMQESVAGLRREWQIPSASTSASSSASEPGIGTRAAVDTKHRWQANLKVKVGSSLFNHFFE